MYHFSVVYHLWAVCHSHEHTHRSLAPSPSPARLPSLSSVDVFFRLGDQRLSCPQHVLVLRSSAAKTCDDRVCEHWGVSGVKCVDGGAVWQAGVWRRQPENASFHLVTSCAERSGWEKGRVWGVMSSRNDGAIYINKEAKRNHWTGCGLKLETVTIVLWQ